MRRVEGETSKRERVGIASCDAAEVYPTCVAALPWLFLGTDVFWALRGGR